ncbi:MAG: regulatory protein RecX [Hornefia sp.]|nr:regulatory protein RecX [Hornefia sp.]
MRRAEDAAIRKLGERSLSVFELRAYLKKKAYKEEEISRVVTDLLKAGYLDDERFCREYFRYAFGKNKGKQRVFAELGQKGVEQSLIQNAYEDFLSQLSLEGGQIDEMEMARKETEKILRLCDLSGEDPVPKKIQGRIGRKLHSFGYSTGIIYSILEELKSEK